MWCGFHGFWNLFSSLHFMTKCESKLWVQKVQNDAEFEILITYAYLPFFILRIIR